MDQQDRAANERRDSFRSECAAFRDSKRAEQRCKSASRKTTNTHARVMPYMVEAERLVQTQVSTQP